MILMAFFGAEHGAGRGSSSPTFGEVIMLGLIAVIPLSLLGLLFGRIGYHWFGLEWAPRLLIYLPFFVLVGVYAIYIFKIVVEFIVLVASEILKRIAPNRNKRHSDE